MIGDMRKFVKFNSYDGGIVKVGNNAACHIKGMGSITIYGKTNTDEVDFADGLKHNFWVRTTSGQRILVIICR